jgi:glycosyltransferase involved in cell wall biosynthesis
LSADPMYSGLGLIPIPLPIFACSRIESSEPGRCVTPEYDLVIGHSGIINTDKNLLSLIDHFKAVLPDMRILYRYHISLADSIPDAQAILESFLEQYHSIDADVEVFVGFLPKSALISWLRKNDLVVFSYSKSSRIGSSASVATCLEAGVPFLVNDSSFFDSVRRKYNRFEEFKASDFDACRREFSSLQVFAKDQFAFAVRRLFDGFL